MNIYEALKKDHDKVKDLLADLVSATEADDDTKAILDSISDELIPHSRAEEAIFYNSLREESDWSKMRVADSFREHAEAETLLRTLQGLDKVNVAWTKAAQKLQEAVEHHIAEEEGETFQKAREVFSDSEAEQMGAAFERMKPEIRNQGTTKTTLDFVANMMPKRFADKVRGFLGQAS